ncbi:hypothetical protein [Garciella nitratireducens]|uniref:hypothetical protein n=2 Tax=Garciella nitratireducens TaxID=218205 RepID=UPI000DE8F31A|nr:hypothetical protein [Garciella nitratireducens]RBP45469.1 hypothetical protein DFR81_1021 [Garciella nitratireducens]
MCELGKYMNKLVELYVNNDEDNFFVGYVIDYDSSFCLIKSIDNKGCFSDYQLIRNSIISNIEVDTNYLEVIDKYIEVSKKIGIYDKICLDTIDKNNLCNIKDSNLLDCILQKEFLDKRVISLCLKDNDDVYFGYINLIEENYIYLNPIDDLSLQEYEKIKILKSDIESLEFKGVKLYLLNTIY